MTLCRHTERIYIDKLDLDGIMNVLARRIDGEIHDGGEKGPAFPFYMGAALAINIFRSRDETRDQSVFMAVMENQLREEGIPLAIDNIE